MYENVFQSPYRERVTSLFLVMVSVDKSCEMTSTWKPGAQFLLTINYMQPIHLQFPIRRIDIEKMCKRSTSVKHTCNVDTCSILY